MTSVGILHDTPHVAPDEVAPEASVEPVLELSGISKRWRRSPVPVLDRIDLQLPSGSKTWIGGLNGAGKTTLLRIAAGVITPDSGEVLARGLSPERDRRAYQAKVGFLSTGNAGLYARLTVHQHLNYQSRLDLLPNAPQAVKREFERLHLADIDGRRVDRLSMGQRQRLRLAMVMIRDPTVLLLDEPRNSLDDQAVAMLLDIVDTTVGRGGAVVWCSPADEAVVTKFDRRFVVEQGRLVSA
jgi:ABC-2 type transport system ATP-binding protein